MPRVEDDMNGPRRGYDIAITGIGCRLPGSCRSPKDLWALITQKGSGSGRVPADRFNIDAFYHPTIGRVGTIPCEGGQFLSESLDSFDSNFFGVSAKEAVSMDPQQRKVLEVAFETLESAGVSLDTAGCSNIGCFVANFTSDFRTIQNKDIDFGLHPYTETGSNTGLLANRVSNFFNLKGPSLTLDTACSSSIYALHLACQSILDGTCDAALVMGTNLLFSPEHFASIGVIGALSPSSQCHTFDASADGYARAEAVSGVFLKRASSSSRDTVRAIIQGTAVNSSGKTDTGITNPSSVAQEAVIRAAYRRAGLDPRFVGYMECHGTGTFVGDPVELDAIGKVFGPGRSPENPLFVGSVKTNLGHAEAASGITAVIKTLLALEAGQVPPISRLDKPNPNSKATHVHPILKVMLIRPVDFKEGILQVATELTPWQNICEHQRFAGVNSFGFGGTNAHVVLSTPILTEKGLERPNGSALPIKEPHLLVFSAQSVFSLNGNIRNIRNDINSYDLHSLSYTLAMRRSRLAYRAFAIIEDDGKRLEEQLDGSNITLIPGKSPAKETTIAFAFTGQGAQWAQMGRELLTNYPLALETIRKLDDVLQRLDPHDRPCWSLEYTLQNPSNRVHEAALAQPLCTALQIAILHILDQCNIKPLATIGHSSGEIAAAYASGLITMDNAIRIAYYRGLLVSTARFRSEGAMMAVGMGPHEVTPFLESCNHQVIVACINSPKSVTLSGDKDIIQQLFNTLTHASVFCRLLETDGQAYHSHHMCAVGETYEKRLNSALDTVLPVKREGLPMFSTVSGKRIAEKSLNHGYWRRNLESPVLFSAALGALIEELPVDAVIEVGPSPALGRSVKELSEERRIVLTHLPTLLRSQDAKKSLLTLCGALFLRNYPVDLERACQTRASNDMQPHRDVLRDLPPYHWDYTEKYWAESRLSKDYRFRKYVRHDLLGVSLPGCDGRRPVWRNILRLTELPWLADHKVEGLAVLPAMAYLIIASEAAMQFCCQPLGYNKTAGNGFSIRNFVIENPVLIPDDDSGAEYLTSLWPVRINNQKTSDDWFEFEINSCAGGNWTSICHGRIRLHTGMLKPGNCLRELHLGSFRAHFEPLEREICTSQCLDAKRPILSQPRAWYEKFRQLGLEYGSTFERMLHIQAEAGQAHTTMSWSPPIDDGAKESEYFLHPTTFDALLHPAFVASVGGKLSDLEKVFLPVSIEELHFAVPAGKPLSLTAHTTAWLTGERALDVNWHAVDDKSQTVILAQNMRLLALNKLPEREGVSLTDETPFLRMLWKPDITAITPELAETLFRYSNSSRKRIEINALCCLCLQQTVACVKTVSPEPHLQRFWTWMKAQVKEIRNGATERDSPEQITEREVQISNLFSALQGHSVDVRALYRLYQSYPAILAGELDGIQPFVTHNLLEDIYRNAVRSEKASNNLSKIMDLLGHKNPNLRILEVGAGTGGTTEKALSALHGDTAFRRYQEYVYSDISAAFLENAQEKFRNYHGLRYSLLDVEKDPLQQNYDSQSFDVVIAANCFHATADIKATLRHAKSLLKNDGYLVLLEVTSDLYWTTMLYGGLKSYWRRVCDSQDILNPFLSKDEWLEELEEVGFEPRPIVIDDYPAESETTTVFVAKTTADCELPSAVNDLGIVYWNEPPTIVSRLATHLTLKGIAPKIMPLSEYAKLETKPVRVISVLDFEGSPFLLGMKTSDYASLKQLIRSSGAVTWLCPGGIQSEDQPDYGALYGWARALAFESSLRYFGTLAVDEEALEDMQTLCGRALSMLTASSDHGTTALEREVSIANGLEMIPRADCDRFLSGIKRDKIASGSLERRLFEPERPAEVAFKQPGLLESVYFKDDVAYEKPLSSNEVEITVHAAGLIYKGVTVALGWYDDKYLSWECTGTVSRVGQSVTHVKPGQRVVGLCLSRFNRYVRTHELLVEKLNVYEEFEDLATMPVSFVTALHAINSLTRLRKGESILIQSASGGLGTAAIQIASLIGAEIFATVSSDSRAEHVSQNLGIPRDHIFIQSCNGIADEVMRRTGGTGIDVILGTSAGEALFEVFRCLGKSGRFVELGRSDVAAHGQLDLHMLRKNTTIHSFDLSLMVEEQPECFGLLNSYLKQMLDLLRANKIRPIAPTRSFHITELQSAIRAFQERSCGGKIVLTFGSTVQTKYIQAMGILERLPSHASYLLVGCLGGLGRSLSNFMIERGAQSLVYLSRSGDSAKEIAEFCATLRVQGVQVVVVRGNVGVEEDVQRAVAQAPFPIRGVVNAAMVLHDSLFDDMSLEDFQVVMEPKVLGTKNLHRTTLDQPLDFFIMLSSICGYLGHTAQSNYAAANTFMDSFARYRRKRGLPATSLALGIVEEVGYASEHPEVTPTLTRYGATALNEKEFLEAFGAVAFSSKKERSINDTEYWDTHSDSYVISGFDPARAASLGSYVEARMGPDPRSSIWFSAVNHIRTQNKSDEGNRKSSTHPTGKIRQALSSGDPEGYVLLVQALKGRLASLLCVEEETLADETMLATRGFDSMTGAELRSWIYANFRVQLGFLEITGAEGTIKRICDKISARLGGGHNGVK